jgi:concanavalin A-like lectin/glucanase superfamily protein
MTIRSGILALAPVAYWPLDDAAGSTVALDASGNGRNAGFEVNSVQQAPGPEVGTFAVGMPNGGGVITSFVNPFAGNVALTMLFWMIASAYPGANNTIVQVGQGGVRGVGVGFNGNHVNLTFDGIGFVDTGQPVPAARWNQVAFGINPGVVQTAWLNGNQVYTAAAGFPNAVLAGDPIYAHSPLDPGLLAHVALFAGVLTTAQIAAMFAARVNPQEISVDGRGLTDIDAAAITLLLNQIYAAVHQTFP